jgi:SAM-dependent methyltransferase
VSNEVREFWDERAREDAFYFVDNTGRYRDPDQARFWASGEETLERMLELLGVSLGTADDVVEVGCGLGRMTRALASRCGTVRAVDVSPEMVARARRLNSHLENVEWIVGDGRSLAAIPNESADVGHSHVVFQHIPDPEVTLGYVREIGRVLRGGGFAFFGISNAPEIHRRRPLASRVRLGVKTALRRGPRGQSDPAWLGSHIEIASLRAAAADANAEIERLEGEGTQYCLVLMRKRADRQ